MNKSISARTVVRKGRPDTTSSPTEKAERPARAYTPSLSEQIAESDVFFKNWQYPNAREAFPVEPSLRSVDRYFPYARDLKGNLSPICFDICETREQIARSTRKISALKKAGIRFLIIEKGMDFNTAMQALGEV